SELARASLTRGLAPEDAGGVNVTVYTAFGSRPRPVNVTESPAVYVNESTAMDGVPCAATVPRNSAIVRATSVAWTNWRGDRERKIESGEAHDWCMRLPYSKSSSAPGPSGLSVAALHRRATA